MNIFPILLVLVYSMVNSMRPDHTDPRSPQEIKDYEIESWKHLMTSRYMKQYVADGIMEGQEQRWKESNDIQLIQSLLKWWDQQGQLQYQNYKKEYKFTCFQDACSHLVKRSEDDVYNEQDQVIDEFELKRISPHERFAWIHQKQEL